MNEQEIFQNSNAMFYWCTKFFPKGVRDDVGKIYTFVRLLNEIVESEKTATKRIQAMEKRWKVMSKNLGKEQKLANDSPDELALSSMAYIVHRYECDPKLVFRYLAARRSDVGMYYQEIEQLENYVDETAGVVGVLLARIIGVKESADEYVYLQARAVQYLEFIKNIGSGSSKYFAKDDLIMFGLKDLSEHEARRKPAEFREFVEAHISRYLLLQKSAKKVFRHIPKRSRIGVRSVVDAQAWMAEKIVDNPIKLFGSQIRTPKTRLYKNATKRTIFS